MSYCNQKHLHSHLDNKTQEVPVSGRLWCCLFPRYSSTRVSSSICHQVQWKNRSSTLCVCYSIDQKFSWHCAVIPLGLHSAPVVLNLLTFGMNWAKVYAVLVNTLIQGFPRLGSSRGWERACVRPHVRRHNSDRYSDHIADLRVAVKHSLLHLQATFPKGRWNLWCSKSEFLLYHCGNYLSVISQHQK